MFKQNHLHRYVDCLCLKGHWVIPKGLPPTEDLFCKIVIIKNLI